MRGLSEGTLPDSGHRVVSAFTTANTQRDPVRDVALENFDTRDRLDTDAGVDLGTIPADWDREDSNILTAALAFEGGGELGRFVPTSPGDDPNIVILDTSRQVFPLFDGSTPDAPPGYEIVGGVFPFTDIDIPKGGIP